MGFAKCLLWRQKTPYLPYASYGTTCKPLPGRLPRPYHHLPHKAPAMAPPCTDRPWAKKVMRGARGSSNLILLIAVVLSLLMCAAAALRPEAFSSGLLKHGRARRVRMRLSLRGHGSAPAKSWDELALHKASVPGFSTPPSVVHEGAVEQPPAEDLGMGPSGGDSVARNAAAVSVATAPQLGALISLLRGDEQRGRPQAAVVGEVSAEAAAGGFSSGVTAATAGKASAEGTATDSKAQPALPAAAQPPPVDSAGSASAAQPPPADPATPVNPAGVAAAAGDAAAATEPARKPAEPVQGAKPAAVAEPAAKQAEPGSEAAKQVDTAAAAAAAAELAAKQAEPASAAAKPVETARAAAGVAKIAVKQVEPASDAAATAASAAEVAAKQADPASGAAAELELAANLANPASSAAGSGEPAAKPADPAASAAVEQAASGGDASNAAALQPPPADGAAASADAVELAHVQAREEAIAEVNRPFDEEYDDDFEGEAGRQKKRRPGLIMFDGVGEEGVL